MAKFELRVVDASKGLTHFLKFIYEDGKRYELANIMRRKPYQDKAAEKLDALNAIVSYATQINEGKPSENAGFCFSIIELIGRIASIGKHDFPETNLESISEKAFDEIFKNSEATEKAFATKASADKVQSLDAELDACVRKYYKQVSSIVAEVKI